MKLKGGVIIIGSLLWQDHLNEKGDNIRLNWRNNNLDMDNKIPVKIPIRYGRISQSNIPTTVYSNQMSNKLGYGYVIPFKKKINNIDELLKETTALSVVEGLKGNFVRKWGVLTYLLNDNKITGELKNNIVAFFKKRKNMDFNINDYGINGEKSCVTSGLELNIDCVKPINNEDILELDNFDILLATATKPNLQLNETKKLAGLIKVDTKRYYYINNISNGIITNDDNEISKLL